jgi:hypothetical protein
VRLLALLDELSIFRWPKNSAPLQGASPISLDVSACTPSAPKLPHYLHWVRANGGTHVDELTDFKPPFAGLEL